MELRELTTSIITAVGSVAGGPAVGDGQAPNPATRPYCIVYDIAGRELWRSLSGGLAGLEPVVQIAVVGDTAESTRIIADQVRAAMLDPSVSLDSANIRASDRQLVSESIDDDPDRVLFRRDLRFSIKATPA